MKTGLLIIGAVFWFIAAWSTGYEGIVGGSIFMLPGLLIPRIPNVTGY